MPVSFGMVVGGLGALGKMGAGFGQMRSANAINPVYKDYMKNPYAGQALGAAQNLFYGRTPGATAAGANIATSQANTLANLRRGSQDASTFLATAGGTQGATNKNYADLMQQEAQSKAALLPSLNQAYAMNVAEGDKAHKSMMDKFMMDTQTKAQLGQAGLGNIFGGFSDIAGGAMQYGNYQNAKEYNEILKSGALRGGGYTMMPSPAAAVSNANAPASATTYNG